jgi:hypothetical protein
MDAGLSANLEIQSAGEILPAKAEESGQARQTVSHDLAHKISYVSSAPVN